MRFMGWVRGEKVKFRCRKVRDSAAAYTDADGKSTPKRGFEAILTPVESQHDIDGGVIEIKVWTFNVCPFQEGHEYDLSL